MTTILSDLEKLKDKCEDYIKYPETQNAANIGEIATEYLKALERARVGLHYIKFKLENIIEDNKPDVCDGDQ
jgi:hypothetical protein